jgi:hypothetical protein
MLDARCGKVQQLDYFLFGEVDVDRLKINVNVDEG